MKPHHRQTALAALAGVLVLLAACTTLDETPAPTDRTDKKFSVATDATNQLGLDLFRQISKGNPDGNLLLSPYSIQSALAMTYAGADGDTRAEMARVLHFPAEDAPLATAFGALNTSLDDAVKKSNSAQAAIIATYNQSVANAPKEIETLKKEFAAMSQTNAAQMQQYLAEEQRAIEQDNAKTVQSLDPHPTELRVANRLFGQKDFEFRQPFLDFTREHYGAPLQPLDFKTDAEAARGTINTWVAELTKDKILDLIPAGSLTASTSLVLVNALYFKAPWEARFDKIHTEDRVFKLHGKETKVPTMAKNDALGYEKHRGYTAVSLPYVGGDLQLLILLPDADNGVDALATELTPQLLRNCVKLDEEKIDLYLPKFKFASPTMRLANEFQALGLHTPFDQPKSSANFDRMAPRKPDEYLAIREVFHKIFFALDEEGTEAAAAAAVEVDARVTSGSAPPVVHVDHPFLFAIQHRESGVCLFLGRVTDPR
jgi:serpin B